MFCDLRGKMRMKDMDQKTNEHDPNSKSNPIHGMKKKFCIHNRYSDATRLPELSLVTPFVILRLLLLFPRIKLLPIPIPPQSRASIRQIVIKLGKFQVIILSFIGMFSSKMMVLNRMILASQLGVKPADSFH